MATELARSRIGRILVERGKGVFYLVAGLPIAFTAWATTDPTSTADRLRHAYARSFWSIGDLDELAVALVVWPLVLIATALWFTGRNGRTIHKRSGRPIWRQLLDQGRAYFAAGILPPWYYVFSLHDKPHRSRSFLSRAETKGGIYRLLASPEPSPLKDKLAFADWCRSRGVRCVQPLLHFAHGSIVGNVSGLPRFDLFAKPVTGKGGRGAERWDFVAPALYRSPDGCSLTEEKLIARWRESSAKTVFLVQPRLTNHPAIADLGSGALSTVRILTCLDEAGEPEVIGAAMRMSVGQNRTVDNFHAGGIAAAVQLESGLLGRATDLGLRARLGWLANHPDTGARIEGRVVPNWQDLCALAIRAHRAFPDRVLVGWDIAPLADGPCIIEGNGSPDLDILQRTNRQGFADGRLGELLAFHLDALRAAA